LLSATQTIPEQFTVSFTVFSAMRTGRACICDYDVAGASNTPGRFFGTLLSWKGNGNPGIPLTIRHKATCKLMACVIVAEVEFELLTIE